MALAAPTTGFELDAQVLIVPAVAEICRVVAVHEYLHAMDCLAIVLLAEGLTLELEVFRFRKMNRVKALRDHPHIIGFDLHALHIGRGVRLFVLFGQPHGNRLSAE